MKKTISLFLAAVLFALMAPVLTLAADAEVKNYMDGLTPKAYDASLEAMSDLPEGDMGIVFNNTSVEGAEMRYQMKSLPANGQYHLSFWYKTDSQAASLMLSYTGEGKSKPMGYKRITVKLPATADEWKQFDMVFKNTDIVNIDGTLYVADIDGNSTGSVYNGIYVRPMQSGSLSAKQTIYFTVPTVHPMTEDLAGNYENVEYTVEDTKGSGEALYNVLGIKSDKGKAKGEVFEVSLASAAVADLYAPIPLPADKILPPLSENLVKNGDMESIDTNEGNEKNNWVPQKGTANWGNFANVDTEVKHGGNASVRLEPTDGYASPFVNQHVNLDALTTYQFIVWTRQTGLQLDKKYVHVKFEFYGEDGEYLRMDQTSECFTGTDSGWTQFEQTFTTPPGTKYVSVILRMKSDGVVWYDDAEFYKVSRTPVGQLKTDQVFYYPSAKSGAATLTVNRTNFPDFDAEAASVTYSLKYGDTVLQKSENVPFCEDTASFIYEPALIMETYVGEEAKVHTVEAVIYSGGEAVQTLQTDVYKYKRPDAIGEDGNYYNADGSLFIPVIGYHVPAEKELPDGSYASLKAGGINVVQIGYSYAKSFKDDPAPLMGILEKLQANDMKALICLYGNMKAAAHADNAANTAAVVQALAGHEAVFGWAVQDEPASQIPNYEYFLNESYKLVKRYDTARPVYICDTLNGYELRNSLYCDVYVDSTYPRSGDRPGNDTRGEALVMDTSAGARLAGKPHYHLVQTYQHSSSAPYFPDITDLRSMLYSALFSGARGTGYYTVSKSMLSGEHLFALPLWEDMTEMVESGEQAMMFDLLAYGGYPVFSGNVTSTQQYRAVLKNGDIYAILLNGSVNGKSEAMTVSMPTVSFNGRASIAGGTVTALYGCTDADVTLSEGLLSVSLPASGVAVVKISGTGVTAEALAETKFTDLSSYPWASDQIEALGRTGRPNSIINWYSESEYRPGEAITRADFAYFLMNTLHIRYIEKEIGYTEQFADVDPGAYYAEAVQMGRRVGIFKGDGTNFNPDAPISRQELMTMVARGMLIRYGIDTAKSADLTAFPDSTALSDWAKTAVSLIVGNGIIKGNADGTLNPLGNTTRAEAAVIMARIAGITPDF